MGCVPRTFRSLRGVDYVGGVLCTVLLTLAVPFSMFTRFSGVSGTRGVNSCSLNGCRLCGAAAPRKAACRFSVQSQGCASGHFLLIDLKGGRRTVSFVRRTVRAVRATGGKSSFSLNLPSNGAKFCGGSINTESLKVCINGVNRCKLVHGTVFDKVLHSVRTRSSSMAATSAGGSGTGLRVRRRMGSRLGFTKVRVSNSLTAFQDGLVRGNCGPASDRRGVLRNGFTKCRYSVFVCYIRKTSLIRVIVTSAGPRRD